MNRLSAFLESRAGLGSLWRALADEPVSLRRAWLYTLGSASLVALLVQFLTGFALALAYAPTPDHAWDSVKAIQTRLPAGALVRGLHHWGASAMVLLVVLHMARTFFFGAYRKPRELNWLVGLALLLLVLAFGFTGYLLPWDQKAYWATVVGARVPSSLPIVGPGLSRLVAGGSGVGASTLTRFYALHVVLLPVLTFALVGAHLLLMRRHGHAGPTDEPDPRQPFFPYQAARDGIVGLLLVAALFWLSLRHPAPLLAQADPADTSYVPRPEWYFLPLFQLLKFFKGPLEPVGTAILPGAVVALLALVPWLDRGKSRRPRDRRMIIFFGSVTAVVVLGLLGFGALDAPKAVATTLGTAGLPPPDPRLLGGASSYEKRGCASCHGIEGRLDPAKTASAAASLAMRPDVSLKGEALVSHVKSQSPKPAAGDDGESPDKDIPSLLFYVEALGRDGTSLSTIPAPIRLGGAVIDREDCLQCHTIYGEGGKRGPALAHIAGKRDRAWIVAHFKEPKTLVPGSKMPSYRFLSEPELAAMADYLLALP